ncbi:hypothetical protein BC831DRAFT_437925 [Entophlyctis helioformis]|nr:hypothetical protein BC831DRAFT_437925 [Entophlyctis helioformis]
MHTALPADQERTSLFKLKARSLKLSPLTMPPVSTAASACLGQQQACMSAYPAMQSCDPTAHTSTTTATPHLQYLPPPSAGIVEQSGYASRPFAMDLLDTGCYSAVEPRGPAFNLSSDFGSSVFQFPLPSYPAYPSGMLNSTANSNNHVVYPMHFPSPISSPSNNVHSFADASNSCNAPEPLAAKERPVHLTINTSVGKANIGPVSAPPACSSDRLFADDAAPASNTRPEPASPYAHISPPSASIMLPRGPVAFIPSSSIRQSFKPYLVSSANLARHYHLQYYRYGSGSGPCRHIRQTAVARHGTRRLSRPCTC